MNYQMLLLTVISIAAFATGCDKGQTTSQQIDKVKVEAKEATQDMKDYAFSQKAEFTEMMQIQLAKINKDLDQLAAKIETCNDAAKAEAKPKLQALRNQVAQLNKQLDAIKNATDVAWDNVKADFKKGCSDLKEGFQNARQWVSSKIAP